MARIYKIIVRFTDGTPDKEFRFSQFNEASEYFEYLVKFVLDGMLHDIWTIGLLKNSHPLKSFMDYTNTNY